MDLVTQQNAAPVEKAAAQSLQEQAGGLRKAVNVFKRDDRPAQPLGW